LGFSIVSSIKRTIIAILLSTISFVIGFFIGSIEFVNSGVPPSSSLGFLGELARFFKPYTIMTVIFIYLKNALAVFTIWLLGAIFMIPSLWGLGFNGYIIGYTTTFVAVKYSLTFALASTLPHGILEIPAIILAGAAGAELGLSIIQKILSLFRQSSHSIKAGLKSSFRFVQVSLILLIPAAIIETYITPLIMSYFL